MRPSPSLRALASALALASGCATTSPARFPLAPPRWTDDDRQPTPKAPKPYWSPLVWDGVDQTAIRPLARALAVEVSHEAVDVNALDEVPDSTWYTNRLATRALTPAEIAAGACGEAPSVGEDRRWTILSGKGNGASLGFLARGPDGKKYVVKLDDREHPEISTAADAIGSRLFWAAGYYTPCYVVVDVGRDELAIDPKATYRDDLGHKQPFDEKHLAQILDRAAIAGDGRLRLGASRWIEGTPLGPFRYSDVRDDDPNDRVSHEDRRELRAERLVAAWTNHWDAREQNTFTAWVPVGEHAGYVLHYLMDFSDTVGGIFASARITRQLGYSYYFDAQHIAEDFVTLGLLDRPWETAQPNANAPELGYFRADDFDPSAWRPGYPNPSFDRMTERDGAWMARILARVTDEDIAAAVRAGRFTHEATERLAIETLARRRDRILARYLTRLSPLTEPILDGTSLCLTDRARAASVYAAADYAATAREGFPGAGPLAVGGDGGRVCVALPASTESDPSVPEGAPSRYRVIEVRATPRGGRASAPIRIALYDLGPTRGYFLAGLER